VVAPDPVRADVASGTAPVEPAVPVAPGVPTVVPDGAGVSVLVVVPEAAGVPVARAVVAGVLVGFAAMPVFVVAAPELADAVALPAAGGTGPPERLIDVADVRLVISEAGGLLVTPGAGRLICVGLARVSGSKLVGP
jgi:hypothetical protein